MHLTHIFLALSGNFCYPGGGQRLGGMKPGMGASRFIGAIQDTKLACLAMLFLRRVPHYTRYLWHFRCVRMANWCYPKDNLLDSFRGV